MSTEKNVHLSFRPLIRSMSVISAGTLTSRVLGFLRDIILAKFFGTGFRADAFFVAFRIPNLFRDLIGEGAANSAVVPVLSEYLHKDEREQFWKFLSIILVLALTVLGFITLMGILLAPYVVRLLAPGFIADPEKLLMTVRLTKIVFPYLVFIGLTAYSMAVLYTFRKFTIPAFSPCLLNIAIIVSALLSVRFLEEPVYGLAAGVLIGGLLQLAVQIPPLFKIGYAFQKPSGIHHPGVVQIGRLLIPRLIGAGIYQLTIFIDTFCASMAFIVGAGGISAIYYSNRIIQLPMGVFSLALASAVLPVLATLAAKNDIIQLRRIMIFSLENILFIMAPVSVITMVLAEPVIRILFQRGAFDAYSTAITSSALLFYAVGLFAFGGIKILVASFHALQDTKTPVKIAALSLLLNTALNFLLMWPLKIAGIALASSIAALVNFILLLIVMNKRIDGLMDGLKPFAFRVILSAGVCGIIVKWSWFLVSGWHDIARLILAPLAGIVVYGWLCFYLKVDQACRAWGWIRSRIKDEG